MGKCPISYFVFFKMSEGLYIVPVFLHLFAVKTEIVSCKVFRLLKHIIRERPLCRIKMHAHTIYLPNYPSKPHLIYALSGLCQCFCEERFSYLELDADV